MKGNAVRIVIILLVLLVIALLVFPIGKFFVVPFDAEEVSSVIVWSFWGYKEATEAEDIAMVIKEMNGIRLCGKFDFEKHKPRDGDYSCQYFFFLKDGRTLEYRTMPKPGLTSLFRDADGIYYKAKGIPSDSILKSLDMEYQSGNPFDNE